MKENKIEKRIDDILRMEDDKLNDNVYDLAIFPKRFAADNKSADAFATFMKKDYLGIIAPKIAWIIVGMVSYFDAEVYLDVGAHSDETLNSLHYGGTTLNSLRHEDLLEYLYLRQLGSLIQRFCNNEIYGLKIALKNQDDISVIHFAGGTNVAFYRLTDEQKELAKDLVTAQGFYFKKSPFY